MGPQSSGCGPPLLEEGCCGMSFMREVARSGAARSWPEHCSSGPRRPPRQTQIRDGPVASDAFKADRLWEVSTGQGVIVAVIDNGVAGWPSGPQGECSSRQEFRRRRTRRTRKTKNTHGTSHWPAPSRVTGMVQTGSQTAQGACARTPRSCPMKNADSDSAGRALSVDASFVKSLRYAVDSRSEGRQHVVRQSTYLTRLRRQRSPMQPDMMFSLVACAGNDGVK